MTDGVLLPLPDPHRAVGRRPGPLPAVRQPDLRPAVAVVRQRHEAHPGRVREVRPVREVPAAKPGGAVGHPAVRGDGERMTTTPTNGQTTDAETIASAILRSGLAVAKAIDRLGERLAKELGELLWGADADRPLGDVLGRIGD